MGIRGTPTLAIAANRALKQVQKEIEAAEAELERLRQEVKDRELLSDFVDMVER